MDEPNGTFSGRFQIVLKVMSSRVDSNHFCFLSQLLMPGLQYQVLAEHYQHSDTVGMDQKCCQGRIPVDAMASDMRGSHARHIETFLGVFTQRSKSLFQPQLVLYIFACNKR